MKKRRPRKPKPSNGLSIRDGYIIEFHELWLDGSNLAFIRAMRDWLTRYIAWAEWKEK